MSDTSARVGVGWLIMLSSMLVATITGFPIARHDLIISPCSSKTYPQVCNSRSFEQTHPLLIRLAGKFESNFLKSQICSSTVQQKKASSYCQDLKKGHFFNRQFCPKISSCNHSLPNYTHTDIKLNPPKKSQCLNWEAQNNKCLVDCICSILIWWSNYNLTFRPTCKGQHLPRQQH
jgi:hypothetical protein